MASYTDGTFPIGVYNAASLPTPRRIALMGPGLVLEQNLTFTSTTATVVGPVTVALSWFLPAGATTIAIPVTYSSALDVSGARPYANLRASSAMGLAAQTVIAPSGGGSQTITFTFSATSAAGNASIDLVVPLSGLIGSTTWAPTVPPGQAAALAPGQGNGSGGVPIVGTPKTLSSASIG